MSDGDTPGIYLPGLSNMSSALLSWFKPEINGLEYRKGAITE